MVTERRNMEPNFKNAHPVVETASNSTQSDLHLPPSPILLPVGQPCLKHAGYLHLIHLECQTYDSYQAIYSTSLLVRVPREACYHPRYCPNAIAEERTNQSENQDIRRRLGIGLSLDPNHVSFHEVHYQGFEMYGGLYRKS